MTRSIKVAIGAECIPVGVLHYQREGQRESCAFQYDHSWLSRPGGFDIDPRLPRGPGSFYHTKPRVPHSSVFFGAFADCAPDGWGARVIERDLAKRRALGVPAPSFVTSADHLLGVDDFTRVGALRLYENEPPPSAPAVRSATSVLDIHMLINAAARLEADSETVRDLEYLMGNGTSLGGMRPKCSLVDSDGSLALAKFPSIADTRSVPHGEVLALEIARGVGINAARSRIALVDGTPIAVIARFDRGPGCRIPYLSAQTLMDVEDGEHTYTEIAEVIRRCSGRAAQDLRELWSRMTYSLLIRNTDDHLRNHGFLHDGSGTWRLSPAFDINPFPDKTPNLKLWISDTTGPDASIDGALSAARFFGLKGEEPREILQRLVEGVSRWRDVATSLGMSKADMQAYAPAFDHVHTQDARRHLAPSVSTGAPRPSRRRPGP